MAHDIEQLPDFLAELEAITGNLESDVLVNTGKTMPPTVSIKGNRFNLVYRKERVPAPNQLELRFIVLAAKEPLPRAFYEGKFDPKEENFSPPACYSLDGVTPETDSLSVQSTACRGCKRSEWGSKIDESGKESTECKQHKQLIIKILGVEGLWLFNIPIGSVKAWNTYSRDLVTQCKRASPPLRMTAFVIKATFDDKVNGVLQFSDAGWTSKIFTPTDITQLKAVTGDVRIYKDFVTETFWATETREQQFLSGKATTIAAPISRPALEAPKPIVEVPKPAPFKQSTPDDYIPPGEPVKISRTRTKKEEAKPVVKEDDIDLDDLIGEINLK